MKWLRRKLCGDRTVVSLDCEKLTVRQWARLLSKVKSDLECKLNEESLYKWQKNLKKLSPYARDDTIIFPVKVEFTGAELIDVVWGDK